MREIKFRAWDKKLKIMSTPFTLLEAFHDYFLLTTDMDVMQYTGIKDPTGKEIYEGDIVKAEKSTFQCETPLEVRFGFYHPLDEVEYGWYVKGKFESSLVWYEIDKLDYLEVIGNIYENPELIN